MDDGLLKNLRNYKPTQAQAESMVLSLMDPASDEILHDHKWFEINYIIEGTLHHELDDGHELVLEKGHICITGPGQKHKTSLGSADSQALNMLLSPEVFSTTFFLFLSSNTVIGNFFLHYTLGLPSRRTCLALGTKPDSYMEFLVERIVTEYVEDRPYADLNIKSLLVLFFSWHLRASFTVVQKHSPRVEQIINHIMHNCASSTLKETAAYFNMHPNYLSSFIKKETGQTFAEITQSIKLAQACQMLSSTSLAVEKIASLLGYSDAMSFGFMFKKHTGVTPSQYRKRGNKFNSYEAKE